MNSAYIPRPGQTWREWFDELPKQPGWEWTGEYLATGEVLVELRGDPDTKFTKKVLPSERVPLDMSRMGCSGKSRFAPGTDNLLHWVFVDVDVGHGDNPCHDPGEALVEAQKIVRYVGYGEIRKSTSGAGIAIGIHLPEGVDLRVQDGPTLALMMVEKAGAKCDSKATRRQCRWLWARELAPDSFQHVEGSPMPPNEESFDHVLADYLEWAVKQPDEALNSRPRHDKYLGGYSETAAQDVIKHAHDWLRNRDVTNRTPLGTRSLVEGRELYWELGLSWEQCNELLLQTGRQVLEARDYERMSRTCRYSRGWKAGKLMSRGRTIKSDEQVPNPMAKPAWNSSDGNLFRMLGKCAFIVMSKLWDRATKGEDGWSRPLMMRIEEMGNLSFKTNNRALDRLTIVGLVRKVAQGTFLLWMGEDVEQQMSKAMLKYPRRQGAQNSGLTHWKDC